MHTRHRPWRRQSRRPRPAATLALAGAIAMHLGLLLSWLNEAPAPGREHIGSQTRLNLRLYPRTEETLRPQVEPRTTASTGQAAQTRPGGRRTAGEPAQTATQPAAVAEQVASGHRPVAAEDPLRQSRWAESGTPWQEELEAAARAQVAAEAAAARSPWPYDTPLPALPFDDYGETPLVALPPEGDDDDGPTVKFLGMSIGIKATPLLDTPNEVGRWISDSPTSRAIENISRSECQPGPEDGANWRRPGWCG